MSTASAAPSSPDLRTTASAPRWVASLFYGLVLYTAACAVCMLARLGDPTFRHMVGLLADSPACFSAMLAAAVVSRHLDPGATRTAWRWLSFAFGLYLTGTLFAVTAWMHGRDPFPGPADVFFMAYYPAAFLGVAYLIRATIARVPWVQLTLDATILSLGFGALFWFMVIRPAGGASQIDVIKDLLSQAYIALNCLLLLSLAVLLMAGVGKSRSQRVPLLLLGGFATMFLADILWSVGKISGGYLPGALQDVLYVASYVPLVAAARAQMQATGAQSAERDTHSASDALAQSLPYLAMLTAFLVLVYLTRGDLAGPTTKMTIVVFGLTLLLMLRQALVLREHALTRARHAARMVEDRYASLIAHASDVIMIVAADGAVRFASPASERTLGLRPDEAAKTNLFDLWIGEDGERLRTFLAEVAATPGGTLGPIELSLARGRERFVLEMVGSNLTADPAVQGVALNLRDISERKALEEQLRQLAFHDPLTLLANRNLFRDRVQHALSLAERSRLHVAVMFLDIDNFKNVNDSLGHDAGDRLLQAVAQRLAKTTRSSDTVARLGGDEFAILLEGTTTLAAVEGVAASLIAELDRPFALSATEVHVSASIGVALSTPKVSADALLSEADIAMYHAKAAGKNRYVLFQPKMQEMLHKRLRLEADIGPALARGEFFLEYQGIVDLGTRSLLGVEALLRWQHPDLGVLMPAQFIHVAEECRQIVELGRWVLMQSCCEMATWCRSVAGGAELRISVNISGHQLQHGDLCDDVRRALALSGLDPGNLVLELTESTFMYNTDVNLERLRALKSLGVRLAIDDFGTGYSSLSYLHRFPIDILKIDRSFVSRLTNTDNGPELARAVITLGHTLGLDTVAEGIELESEVAALLSLGCVAGQGYLFAKPGSLAELADSSVVARRNALWTAESATEDLSPTGRFKALSVAS